MLRDAMTASRDPTRAWVWDALVLVGLVTWLCVRLGTFGLRQQWVFGLPAGAELLPFLFVDQTWVVLVPVVAILAMRAPSRIAAAVAVCLLSCVHAVLYSVESLARYYRGEATAYDLGNFIQPLWRAAHGQSMTCTWLGDVPLWADHGSFSLVLFAPFTRVFDDAASGVLIAQACVAAAWIPVLYACARAMSLERGAALLLVIAASSSRALHSAVVYDFHAECLLPLLFIAVLLAHAKRWPRAFFVLAIFGALLKDMAALTLTMALFYLAVTTRERRIYVVAFCVLAIGMLDVLWLPSLAGNVSYIAMNSSAPNDHVIGLASTGMRALSSMLLGWLHPFAWVAGAPWILASTLSPKLAVKGIEYQYSFLFVPVAFAGVLFVLSALQRRGRAYLPLTAGWALLCVVVNAPPTLQGNQVLAAASQFSFVREKLLSPQLAPPELSVATDACLAPYLIDRSELFGLCVLDVQRFTQLGEERWTFPTTHALRADRIVIDRACTAHGACIAEQIAAAERQGFRVSTSLGSILMLRKP